jgi:hypothetical protein
MIKSITQKSKVVSDISQNVETVPALKRPKAHSSWGALKPRPGKEIVEANERLDRLLENDVQNFKDIVKNTPSKADLETLAQGDPQEDALFSDLQARLDALKQ